MRRRTKAVVAAGTLGVQLDEQFTVVATEEEAGESETDESEN